MVAYHHNGEGLDCLRWSTSHSLSWADMAKDGEK